MKTRFALLLLLPLAFLATACGDTTEPAPATDPAPVEETAPAADAVSETATETGDGTLTLYSGRNEKLIGPILERFREESGIEVEVRYGDTAEMAATLMEEGPNSPADLFLSQDAAALGAVADAGLLKPLPRSILDRVETRFADPDGQWVGLSGRARAIVYSTERTSPSDLPQSLEEVADPKYKGTFGIAPLNGSLQAHMAVYRAARGEAALGELLTGIAANEPKDYRNNMAIVEAVLRGEVDWGLTNHYYLYRVKDERPDAPAANFFPPDGAATGFINAAGIGALHDTEEARRLIAFLLADEAQQYFAEETFEYPLVASVSPAPELPPLADLDTAEVDYGDVSEVLETTIAEIQSSGLVR